MKAITVGKDGRELNVIHLSGPLLLVGRSPVCDAVVRVKGLKPVHFMIEWIGEGDFDPMLGSWTVFDVSGAGGTESGVSSTVGQGLVISEKPVTLKGITFALKEDRLIESHLKEGVVEKSFRSTYRPAVKGYQPCQLEVVSIRQDTGSLFGVAHLNPILSGNRSAFLTQIPIRIEWSEGENGWPVRLDMSSLKDVEAYQKGSRVQGAVASLGTGDFVHIRWQMASYYFRLVPLIDPPRSTREFFSDRTTLAILVLLLLTGAVLSVFRGLQFEEEKEKPPEPPRVARIEIRNPDLPPPPPPPPPVEAPPVAEPPPPTPEKVVESKPAKTQDIGQKPKDDAPAPSIKKKDKVKKPGLVSPAPQQDVSQVGLLAAMKPNKVGTVKADQVINNGLVSKVVSGPSGSLNVDQPPSGKLARKTTPGDLTSAYTSAGSGDSQTGKAVSISGTGSTPGGGLIGAVGSSGGGIIDGHGGEFSTEGGLDKESVKRAIEAHRREIRTCYERALLVNPKTNGRVSYKWQITPDGKVNGVQQLSSSVNAPSLPSCVQKIISGILFPEAPNHQSTIVIYPFEFQAKK